MIFCMRSGFLKLMVALQVVLAADAALGTDKLGGKAVGAVAESIVPWREEREL